VEANAHDGDDLRGRVTAATVTFRAARWRARAPRYLALGLIAVLSALGLRTLIAPDHPALAPRKPPAPRDAASEDFALQFARAYLTYDAARPGARQAELAAFVPHDLDPDAGLTPDHGSQHVLWAEVASNQTALAGGRVITIAAQTDTHPQPLYLAVTVRHDPGHPIALVGYPSLVGAPTVAADSPPPARGTVDDAAVTQVATRVVRNYLAGQAQDLAADLTGDAAVTLPTIALTVQSVDQVVWTGAGPSSGAVLATVTATDAVATTYRLTYELGIAYRERPYVDFIEVVPTDT
jgi:hypothetical protein